MTPTERAARATLLRLKAIVRAEFGPSDTLDVFLESFHLDRFVAELERLERVGYQRRRGDEDTDPGRDPSHPGSYFERPERSDECVAPSGVAVDVEDTVRRPSDRPTRRPPKG